MDRANLELARFLAGDGPVHLVTHRAAEDLAAHPNVTVHTVPRPFGRHLLGQPLLARAGRAVAARLAGRGFRVVVNGGNCRWPDVNWAHYIHAAYRADGLLGKVKGAIARRDERAAMTAARVVVCNSERTRRDAIERLGVRPERAVTVYLGSDPEQFFPTDPYTRSSLRARLGWPTDRPVVAFVGAIGDRRKGLDTLIAAWIDLTRQGGWDPRLVVIGQGRELPLWQARVSDAGLTDSIQFLGFRKDVPDLLRAADILVAPTRYESYGLGVQEALCCGLPALVTAAAGVSERYPPGLADLILTDPESAGELANRLRLWRANLGAFADRVRPLADELRAHTWADMARDFRDTVLRAP
jgi:glycosyltransferase involved in cell wall biosynthesis